MTAEIADRLKMYTPDRRGEFQRQLENGAEIVGIDAGNEGGHQHHADIVLGAPVDGQTFLGIERLPPQFPVNLVFSPVELQENG